MKTQPCPRIQGYVFGYVSFLSGLCRTTDVAWHAGCLSGQILKPFLTVSPERRRLLMEPCTPVLLKG